MLQKFPIPKRSFLQRLFKQYPEEGALIELNNLLVGQGVSSVSQHDIEMIGGRYKVDVCEMFALNLLEYCIVFFADCLKKDGWLSPENQVSLSYMVSLFKVNPETLKGLQREIAEPVFRRKMTTILRDGKITRQEEEKLSRLASTAMIPQQVVAQIREELTQQKWKKYISAKLKLERLSPSDEEELNGMAEQLGIQPVLDKDSARQWLQLRKLWDVENLELPVLHTMDLHKSTEECYYSATGVEWHEERVHQAVPYLKHIDTGTLMLTNKQLIFSGKNKIANLKYSDIRDFIRQGNTLEIRKYSGRNPSLSSDELDVLAVVLARLIAGNIQPPLSNHTA